jgi:hypothetical protein
MPTGGAGHLGCFDFDESTNVAFGWTNALGAVAIDSNAFSSPPYSAYVTLASDGGALRVDGGAEQRLVRRFNQPVGSLRCAFELRADSLPTNRGYAFATIAFFSSPGARVSDRSLSLVLTSTGAFLSERVREDGLPTDHQLQDWVGADGRFHRIEIALSFASDGGGGTADAIIDGQLVLSHEPLSILVAQPFVGAFFGIFSAQAAIQESVAAHYDNVTVDIAGP